MKIDGGYIVLGVMVIFALGLIAGILIGTYDKQEIHVHDTTEQLLQKTEHDLCEGYKEALDVSMGITDACEGSLQICIDTLGAMEARTKHGTKKH